MSTVRLLIQFPAPALRTATLACLSSAADNTALLKMLIPEREVGNVIGKAGAVLRKIQEDSGARIRFSQVDEVVPVPPASQPARPAPSGRQHRAHRR